MSPTVDEPPTDRQQEVVEAIAVAGGTLTAGLSGALAGERYRPVTEVLSGAAATLRSAGAAPLRVDSD